MSSVIEAGRQLLERVEQRRSAPSPLPEHPDVSVLMRIRDGISGYAEGSLKRALDSALQQQGNLNVEVIAVDNGSRDNTGEFLRDYAETVPVHNELKIVTLQENVGEAEALNIGVDQARGRYCIQLTCRSWYEPESLKHLVAVLAEPAPEHNPPVGFAFGCMEVHGVNARYHTPPPWNLQTYSRTFLANFFMFLRDMVTRFGCRFEDYLTLDDGSLVGICDRDFMMQMLYRVGVNGRPLPEVKVLNYHFTGENQMSNVVKAHRSAIDAEWRKRWGEYL